ncbi:retron Eco8 family effector endonuclease [Clostridium nigeriense]|uniref:retron Eco8 family effector endonuclease n=1 Tax=Clostridium nigeriense TaxID=1805470 RepID=UPI003D33031A
MPINSIKIRNFKSLKKIDINLNNNYDIHCFLGRNGSGKSNLLDALNYFYDNLNKHSILEDVIDNSNPYIQRMEITLVYELSELMIKNPNQYIKDSLDYLGRYMNDKNQIFIKLVQYRDVSIRWYPNDKKLLKIIHRLFPIYLIDTRFIDLQDWNIIWEIMSDLSQTTLKLNDKDLEKELDNSFENIYGDKYVKSLKIIEKIFNQENIKINKYDYTNRFKNSLITRFGSDQFLPNGNKLEYYSDGLNSFKYLKLLLYLVPNLAGTGWKNPMLIIDEPEIGLHPQYIDSLVKAISNNSSKGINILISTHSPNLVSELIKQDIRAAMFRASMVQGYTKIEKMNEIVEEINKPILTINESNCYFSKAVVFVEGTSEMQLLSHKLIKTIFPSISKVNFYPYNSNNTKLRFINPEIIKFNIPYIILVDMDKIIKFTYLKDSKEGYFKVNSDELVNPLSNINLYKKEQLLYYSKKDYKKHFTYNLRQYITKMLTSSKFKLVYDLYYIQDYYFEKILKFIKHYCAQYNVFPVSTTVEGLIVTQQSLPKIISWIKEENKCDLNVLNNLLDRDKTILGKEDVGYRTTIIRLICNGKLDTLETLKQINKDRLSKENKEKIIKLRSSIGSKTDGWIISFMNYYINKYINVLEDDLLKKDTFKKDFPELFFIMQKIESMV